VSDRHKELHKQLDVLRAENAALREKIAVLGELAVANWDDKTVGECDAITKDPLKYKDMLRRMFVDQPRELSQLRSALIFIRSTTDKSGLSQAQVIEEIGNYCDEILGKEDQP
jgi:hypothetical protein